MELNAGLTAVVTGAGSGIGLAISRALVDRGLNVVMADLDEARLTQRASELGGLDQVVAVPTDVSDPDAVIALATRAATEFGPVHVLANNAGILRPNTVYEQSLEDWHAVVGVNIFGVIHGYRAFVPDMLAHGQPAHVLNTASLGGLIAAPQAAAYMVSKHADIALSEALAADTAGTNIGVTVLCPGGVSTDIFAAEQRRRRDENVKNNYSPEVEARFARIADPSRPEILDPGVVAEVALDGVVRGELYAFVFPPESRLLVRARLAAIERAIQVDEARTAAVGA